MDKDQIIRELHFAINEMHDELIILRNLQVQENGLAVKGKPGQNNSDAVRMHAVGY